MKWEESYNVYRITCGILELSCVWEGETWTVKINHRTLRKKYRELGDAQAAAVLYARQLINEVSTALGQIDVGKLL